MPFIHPNVKSFSLLIALAVKAASIVHRGDASSAVRMCNFHQRHKWQLHFDVRSVWHRGTSTAFLTSDRKPYFISSSQSKRSSDDRRTARKAISNVDGNNYEAADEFAYTSFFEASEVMQQCLPNDANSELVNPNPISIIGYVSRKRKLGRSLAFIDIVPGKQSISQESDRDFLKATISTLWKRQDFLNHTDQIDRSSHGEKSRRTEKFDVYLATINPGTKVLIAGVPRRSRNSGEIVLLVQSCRLLGVPGTDWRYLKSILEWTDWGDGHNDNGTINESNGLLRVDEVAKAARMNPIDLRNLASLSFSKSTSNAAAMEAVAREILERFPFDEDAPDLREVHMQQPNIDKKISAPALPHAPSDLSQPPDEIKDVIATGVDWTSSTMMTVNEIVKIHVSNVTTSMQVSTPIFFSGWVQARRRFSDSISVLKIVDNFRAVEKEDASNSNFGNVVSCVLHPELMHDKKVEKRKQNVEELNNRESFWAKERNSVLSSVNMYGALLARGAKVQVQGVVTADDMNMNKICWVTNIRLIHSSWAPSTINYILKMLSDGNLDFEEVAISLSLRGGINEAQELALLTNDRLRYWRAVEISSTLQDEQSQRGSIIPEDRRLLQELSPLRAKFPLTKISSAQPMKKPDYDLDLQKDVPFYIWQNRRGPSSSRKLIESSRFQTKKEPQLQYMVSEISRITKLHPDYLKRPLQILDIGGGKGHLANALASVFNRNEVIISVVDIDKKTIKNGKRRSIASGLGVSYWIGDASILKDLRSADDVEDTSLKKADIVVALHACGVLTDV